MGYESIGIGGWESQLAPPTPLQKELNDDSSVGRFLPTPDNDGSYIRIPTSNVGDLERYNAAGSQVWTNAHTDIHVDADFWTGVFWLDTSDSAIWVWVYDTGTTNDTYYLAKVALSTGTVTNVGSCQPATDSRFTNTFKTYYAERAAMGSGDLTIRDGDYKIVINTSDGTIVTATAQVTQNGTAINAACDYETADGLIYLKAFGVTATTTAYVPGWIMRGGTMAYVMLPRSSPNGNNSPYFMLWGGYVAMTNGNYAAINARFFERADLDAWLTKIADYYGLPD